MTGLQSTIRAKVTPGCSSSLVRAGNSDFLTGIDSIGVVDHLAILFKQFRIAIRIAEVSHCNGTESVTVFDRVVLVALVKQVETKFTEKWKNDFTLLLQALITLWHCSS